MSEPLRLCDILPAVLTEILEDYELPDTTTDEPEGVED